jgi:hypothetical protein
MTLLNGLVLGIGGLLLAIPIILHFLMQPKPKEMVFPALKFVKQKQMKNRRQMRVRHFVLLLLRCLLILAIAAALAGPTVAAGSYSNWMTLGLIGFAGILVAGLLLSSWLRKTPNGLLNSLLLLTLVGILGYGGWVGYKLYQDDSAPVIGNNQAPVAAVLVVDTSPRMLYERDNQSSLEKAKELGQWLIGQFPLDSQVSILHTDGDSPFFSVDVSAAQKRLKTTSPSFISASVPEAISEGLKLLGAAEQERKEIYVLSDLTLRSWSNADAKKIENLMKKSQPTIYVLDVGTENTVNFSVNSIRLNSSSLTKNSTLRIEADILRRGPAAERTVRMQLEKRDELLPVFRNGQAVWPESGFEYGQIAKLSENGAMTMQFQTSQELKPGIHHGKIEVVGDDGLSIDDEKYFTVEVRDAWKVLLVHPNNVRPWQLQSAIESELMFQCETVTDTEMSTLDPADYQAIYWLNPKPLSEATWGMLANYVENGGGLGLMLGHNAQNGAEADASFQTPAAQKLLTGTLTFPFRAPKADRPEIPRGYFLSPGNFAHPVMAEFAPFESNIDWTDHRVLLHWGIEPDEAEFPTQTVLKYNNQESALIERQIGQGRVLVMTTPMPEPLYPQTRSSWNQLFSSENFPILVLASQMTKRLVGSDTDSLNIGIGQSASLKNDPRSQPEVYTVFTPDPEKSPTQSKSVDDKVRYKFTELPGHYRLSGSLLGLGRVQRGFSVNLSTSDTDLNRLEPDQLDSILGEGKYLLAKEKEEIQRKQGAMREGQSFYPMLIMLMLLILAIENLMSNRFYGPKRAVSQV